MLDIEPYGETVRVNGRCLTSAIDPKAEAIMQAKRIPLAATEAWLYGPALGHLARVLLKRRSLRRLHVCVMNRELHGYLHPLPRDSRIALHMPGEALGYRSPFAVSPAELQLAEPSAHPLRDLIIAKLNAPFYASRLGTSQAQWSTQEAANAPLLAVDPSALSLRDARDAIVIAGGPTLSAHFDWIRAHAATHSTIAVARSLIPLLAVGIVPAVVVLYDRDQESELFLPDDSRLADSILVYVSATHPAALARWKGRRASFRDGEFYAGGSVAHVAADLATRMGARTIHLLGFDFSFPEGQSHVEGAAFDRYEVARAPYRTVDGHGREVPTQETMMMYHRCMELLIAERGLTQWVKHDRRGVPLRGAAWHDVA